MKESNLNQKKIFISLYCVLTLINLIMFSYIRNVSIVVEVFAAIPLSFWGLVFIMATLTFPTFTLYAMISKKLLKGKNIFFKIIIWAPLLMNLFCLWLVIEFLYLLWEYFTRPVNLHWY